jgi:hypothetical protein
LVSHGTDTFKGTDTTNGMLTTYTYSAGSLQNIAYTNDPANTPGVTYTFDAMGRQKTVTKGATPTPKARTPTHSPTILPNSS